MKRNYESNTTCTLSIAALLVASVVCASGRVAAQPAEPDADTSPSVGARAIAIVRGAIDSDNPVLRSNAVELAAMIPGEAMPIVRKGLRDDNEAVRYAAAVTAGRLNLKYLAPTMRALLKDEHASVRAAALYALHRMGEDVDITPLAEMLMGRDVRLRAHVATILGLIGDRSAIPLLQQAAQRPMPKTTSANQEAVVRTQFAEAMAKLGDEGALEALRSGAFSPFGEVRVLSVMAMGAVGDQRMATAVGQFVDGPPVELQIAAAGTLARLGDERGRAVVLGKAQSPDPVIRSQAAWALGWFSDAATEAKIGAMLNDEHPQVRIHAAASALRRTGRRAPRN